MTTETVIAWISKYSMITPQALAERKPGLAAGLTYTSDKDLNYWAEQGYSRVGTAEITLHLIDNDTMVLNKIESLKAEAAKTRAEAALRCNEIEGQIQNLLAITYTPNANDELRG